MNIRDAQASLEYLFKAELTGFLWGHAGIGKSSIIKQYANSKGYHFFPLYLGTMSDLGDVLGLAEFVTNEDGSKSTVFANPKWLKDAITYCEENPESGAIIFLDEFNRARRDVLNGMFSLALDKTFHTVKLPKNCHVIAAGNPPTDEYAVTDVDETALMARFVHIKLEPTFDEWLQYAKSSDMNPTLISFFKEQPDLLEKKHSHFELPIKPDRRAVSHVNRLMKLNPPEHILEQLMAGVLGIETAVAYNLHLRKSDKALTGEEVLKGVGIDNLKVWSQAGDIKSSILSLSCDNVFEEVMKINSQQDALLTEEQSENLFNFINLVPKDLVYVLIQKFINKDCLLFKTFSQNPKYKMSLIEIVKTAKGMTA